MTLQTSLRRRAGFAALLLAGSSLSGLVFWQGEPAAAQTAPPTAAGPAPIALPTAPVALPGFGDLVARVQPAVVTITATERPQGGGRSPFPPGSSEDQMFHRFFGGPDAERSPMRALGSGFLIDAAGHIVTNNHVVSNAASVRVTLQDGQELPARVVGRDPRTDLALLKVEGARPLPFLRLGDSDKARPGDWVVAVGNPFGLGGSVTAGIVSARGRNINAGPYDDFIQIDAPINQGNSGGPLFALDGTVIGVNTAIFSPSGGSVGIGFAIPANMVRQVTQQLEAHGQVERGFLGASTQAVTPALAAALQLPAHTGALVADVQADGPAARAGLRAGDVVTAAAGTPVLNPRDLARAVADAGPGATVPMSVTRDGQRQELHVTLAKLHDKDIPPAAVEDCRGVDAGTIGVTLAPVTDAAREVLNLPPEARGALVTAVRPGSPAQEAGLNPGDLITAVGPKAVNDAAAAASTIREALRTPSASVALRVRRDNRDVFVALRLGRQQG